jgi:phosphoribosyl 1,2-cyclic phosphate phosphodiesterase
MRILFLGTGSAWPIPRLGCDCRQCAAARAPGSPDARTRSAALLEATPGGPLVLLDAGPDIYRQLAPLGKPAAARIAALLITHVHPDHYLGLVDLAAALPRAVPLYCLADNLPAIEATFGYLFPGGEAATGKRRGAPPAFEPRVIRFGEVFEWGGLRFEAFDTLHFSEFATAGIIAEAGGRRLAYAPDFRRTERDLRGLDLLVIDGSTIERGEFGHISIREGIAIAREARPGRTIFTHVGHVKVPHAEIEALVKREGGERFAVAIDGMRVEV